MNTLKHGISTVLLLLGAACSSDNTTDAPRAVLTVGISIDGEEFRQGEPIQFYGNAEVENGEIASYFWHFGFRGDETNHAEVQNPLVTFPAGGNFTVKFTVTSRDGAVATATREIYVIPDNMRPTAAFAWDPAEIIAGSPVRFSDASFDTDGEVVAWHWDFGDESTSEEQNPEHTYASEGFYMVTLSVTDDLGGTAEKQSTIRVISGTPEKQWNILWSKDFATGGSLATVSAAVGDDARIYALSTLGQLYAYDRDGNQLWSFDLTQNGTVLSTERLATPSVDTDGTVYVPVGNGVSGSNGYLYAIDGATGSEKWKLLLDDGAFPDLQTPVITTSYVAIGNHGTNGTFRIIDKATGTVKYAAQPSGGVYGGICATRTDVFFSCAKNDRGYFTYLPENGDWLMSTLSNNYGYGHSGKYTNPALDDAGNLYLAMCEGTSEKGYIACYVTEEFDDTAPVQATWSYTTEAPVTVGGCVLGAGGEVYALTESTSTSRGELIALSASGARLWSYPTPEPASGVPAVDSDGNIHYCDKAGYYTVLTSGGEELYREKIADAMETSPVISDYGIVYVLGQSGGNCRLYAIDIGIAGPADSPWPQRGQNARHSSVQR